MIGDYRLSIVRTWKFNNQDVRFFMKPDSIFLFAKLLQNERPLMVKLYKFREQRDHPERHLYHGRR